LSFGCPILGLTFDKFPQIRGKGWAKRGKDRQRKERVNATGKRRKQKEGKEEERKGEVSLPLPSHWVLILAKALAARKF